MIRPDGTGFSASQVNVIQAFLHLIEIRRTISALFRNYVYNMIVTEM